MGSLGNLLFLVIGVGATYVVVKQIQKAKSPTGATTGNVSWDPNSSSSDLGIQGPTLVKLGPYDGWQASGVVSLQKIQGNGFIEMKAPAIIVLNPQMKAMQKAQGNYSSVPPTFTDFVMNPFVITTGGLVFGITTNDQIQSFEDIDYGIKLGSDGSMQIVERGVSVFDPSFKPGDDLKIINNGGVVTYLQNGQAVYTSLVPLNLPWKAAASIFNVGQTLSLLNIQGTQ